MKWLSVLLTIVFLWSCKSKQMLSATHRNENAITGSAFYRKAAGMNWQQRDSFAMAELLAGNMPDFLRTFVPVSISYSDSHSGIKSNVTFYVMTDYVCIGSNTNWSRIPLTPMAAQQLADSFHCFLPTRKLVDEIYKAASVKIEPVPMYAYRDSSPTMYQHHLIVEGQRQLRRGLIAGIKKDVILAEQLSLPAKQDKVAIYGWHHLSGKPIQPVYTGHINWYVDYSHGIRLIYERIKVNGKWMHYTELARNPTLLWLLTDEPSFNFTRYPY